MRSKSTIKILLADDDSLDRELFKDAMKETDFPFELDEVVNGKELLAHLKNCQQYPDLIFLDLNMPIMDGRETLAILKKSEKLKVIPVFVLSTSSSQQDICESYLNGANLFLVKPSNYDSLVQTLRNIVQLMETSLYTVETV